MDPERPIEKLLREQGKKRLDEARTGFEPHPATRKMLRDEAVRTLAAKTPSRPSSRKTVLFWPRLLWATAILAVLGVMVYMLVPVRPEPGENTFAQNGQPSSVLEQTPPSPAEIALTEQPARPGFSPDFFDRAKNKELAKDSLGRRIEPSTAPSPQRGYQAVTLADSVAPAEKSEVASSLQAATAAKSLSPAQNYGLDLKPSNPPVVTEELVAAPAVASARISRQASENEKLALAPAPAAPAAAEPSPQRFLSVAPDMTNALAANANLDQQATIHQKFAQVQPVTKAKAGPADAGESRVLASFQLEQSGNQLRIVDTDGSVYAGELGQPQIERARLAENRTAAAPAVRAQSADRSFQLSGKAGSSAPQTFSFQVTGTNRTSNQKVVFTGILTPVTNLSVEKLNNSVSNGRVELQNSLGGQNFSPLSNSRISGSAQIGRSNTVKIEAVPAP